MRKFQTSPIYIYSKKKKMSGRGLSQNSDGRWYVQFADGSKMQVTIGRCSKAISESDYKWISGAESKRWKRNKTAWDNYQTSRAHRIIQEL